jgi:HEAT repeat protein
MRLLALLLLTSFAGCAQPADIRSAFQEVRRGNYDPVAKLKVTAADAPVIAELVRDSNENVVREAVTLLEKLGGPAACAALVPALTSPSADVRERTARALHSACSRPGTEGIPNLEAALRQSVELGNSAAAALLMLGRFQDNENREFLKRCLPARTPLVKLNPWSAPVPQGLAAAVAGVSAGVAEARPWLVEGLSDLAQAEFLASVLPDVTDLKALLSLLLLLDNKQTIRSGVPSGAQPQRRLCDLAVDAFVTRLGLHPAFSLRTSDRYSDEEIAEVKKLAAGATAKH